MNFQQESGIPDKVESGPATHAKEEGKEREILQVPKEGIHKTAELLTKTVPFQLPLFLQTTPRENICSCPPLFLSGASSQGELKLMCPMIKELAWDTSSTENFWLDVHSYNDPMDRGTTWSRKCFEHL